MTQLLSLFNHVFGNQSKSKDLEQLIQHQSHITSIKKSLGDILEAWVEARAQQAKYYNTHSHIE